MSEKLGWFSDFPPEDCARRNHLFRIWRQTAHRFFFQEYDGPVLEPLDLYVEKSGPEIVSQLFTLQTKGEKPKQLALRPEMTPSLARMIAERAPALKKPVKWFSIGDFYRYERQQAGRKRSFYQFNADIFGEAGPSADAELIALAVNSLETFGLGVADFKVRLSDRNLWLLFLEGLGLEGEAALAVLGVVDKMERAGQEDTTCALKPLLNEASEDFLAKALALTEARDLASVRHFLTAHAPSREVKEKVEARLQEWESLLEALECFGVREYVQIDLGIVRGLAYYTGFVWEVFELREGARALAGGGRYDDLVEKLGGAPIPAVGFAMGNVTLELCLAARDRLPRIVSKPDLFCIIGGEAERKVALQDIAQLRRCGLSVDYPLKQVGFKKQFKLGDERGAALALIYGSDELAQNGVKLRDLRSGQERLVRRADLLPAVHQAIAEGLGEPDQ